MTTFSKLVDDIVIELKRPDLRVDFASYANQTIREVHFRPAVNAPILFDANRIEDLLTVDTDGSWLWTIPSVTSFQSLELAMLNDSQIIIEPKSPRVMATYSTEPWARLGWYRTGHAIAFGGVSIGQQIAISYFMFPRGLAYKPVLDRVVAYDVDTDSYNRVGGGAPLTDDELAKETNWILQRWEQVVKEGVRTKAFKRMGDELRTRTFYSSYEQARTGLWNSEPAT